MAQSKQQAKPQIAMNSHVLVKAESGLLVSNRRELEDDFVAFYESGSEHGLIRPPYDLRRLEQLVEMNNTLGPCIDAMVTNIDGTGYEIARRDGEPMADADWTRVQPAVDFFDECAPMMSFQTLRKQLRRELESTGCGYIEVIRNIADEIVFAGPLESKMMRFGKLGDPVMVDTVMVRGGKEVTFKRLVRERRFAQKVGEQLIWFKEFGSSRDLDKYTGLWAADGERLPADKRASEVLYFGVNPDVTTPYCTPRWISQTPSVVGSRQAEEHNLEYFSSGGIPPYLVIVQGGQLAAETVEAVRSALNQKGAHARVQVIEAFSTSGDLGSSGNVQVKVERFGGEKTDDAMFQNYDAACEARVRKAFRLPPILIGKAEDYSFASAHASYLVAEAQVFKPERDEFDEVITATLLTALIGTRDYMFRSKPISIVDASTKLEVLNAAKASGNADPENLITLLGEVGGMDLAFKEIDPATLAQPLDPNGNVIPINRQGGVTTPKPVVEKSEDFGFQNLLSCTLAVMQSQPQFALVDE